MNERRPITSDSMGRIESLAVNNNVVKKYCIVVERGAIWNERGLMMAVDRGFWKVETKCLG